MTLSKLVSWVEKNAATYNIQHFETEVHPDVKDQTNLRFFRTTMDSFGRTFGGYGSSPDPELALTKSISECIERAAAIGQFGIRDSSGNACHFDPEIARHSAVLELLERDAFFTHFLTLTPFQKLGDVFYRMQSADEKVHTILCKQIRKFSSGEYFILSAGADENLELAKLKALNENFSLTNNYLYHKDLPYHSAFLNELAAQDKFGPGDHAKLFFSPDHARWFEETFFHKAEVKLPELSKPKIEVKELDFSGTMFEGCGLRLFVASSPDLQVAFWGHPKKQLVNMNRLHKLCPGMKDQDVPWKKLHLFG